MIRRALPALLLMSVPALADDGLGSQLPRAPIPGADVADPIGAAIAGLVAEVEDDLSDKDHMLEGNVTRKCVTRLSGGKARWRIDWRTVKAVAPGDTFVFVEGRGVRLAIVGDASIPDQAKKLGALYSAMLAMHQRCRKAG